MITCYPRYTGADRGNILTDLRQNERRRRKLLVRGRTPPGNF